MLILHIGSENPQKIAAAKEEFDIIMPGGKVIAVNAASGVGDQPQSLSEVIEGARGRAKNSVCMIQDIDVPGINLGVGLESGLAGVQAVTHVEALFTITCCAIHRSKLDRNFPEQARPNWIYGYSSAFTIPEKIMFHVKKGLDLSQATKMAGYTVSANIGNEEGLIGILSDGRVTRKDQLREAVRNALFQLDTLL